MAGLLTEAAPIGAAPVVAAELHRWAVEPFDLGVANCGLSVVGYVSRVTGAPIPSWLHAFGARGAALLMRDGGLFEQVASDALAEMGCPETAHPEHGDVALVRLDASGLLTACIRAGALWAARGERSAELGPGTILKGWRVACRKP